MYLCLTVIKVSDIYLSKCTGVNKSFRLTCFPFFFVKNPLDNHDKNGTLSSVCCVSEKR